MAIELSKIAQNELLMTLANGEIRLLNLNTLQTLHSFNGLHFGKYIKRAIFGGPNERFILVGTGESTIFIGDRNCGNRIRTLSGCQHHVNAMTWKPSNERTVASCSDDGTIV